MCEKKVCTRCEIEKDLVDYYKDSRSKDGKMNRCKVCINSLAKEKRRKKNPKKYDSKKYRKEANEEAFLRGNKICSKCDDEKSLSEYGNDKRAKDGKNSSCKECERKRGKEFREDNKELLRERSNAHYKANCDKINARNKVRYYDNIEWENQRSKNYRDTHLEEEYLRNKRYKEENRDRLNARDSAYQRMRRETEPLYRIICNVRSLIKSAYNNKSLVKESKSKDILGCDWEVFEQHLNDNPYGFTIEQDGLDIDHIVPISKANTEEDVFNLNHYSNFQLLPSSYNRHVKIDKPWDKEDFEQWLSENYSW